MRWADAVDPTDAAALRCGIKALTAAGRPPAWIWAYDVAWRVALGLSERLVWFLGDDPVLPPHFWAWRVDGVADAGWPPHRDWSVPAVRDDVTIGLTVWIPLTDVGLDDGCIGLVRCDQDSALASGGATIDPRAIRMLPARIGDVLAWRADALHWGGRPSRFAAGPRISIAFEAQNRAFPAAAEPALRLDPPPSPAERFAAIAARLERYGRLDAQRAAAPV